MACTYSCYHYPTCGTRSTTATFMSSTNPQNYLSYAGISLSCVYTLAFKIIYWWLAHKMPLITLYICTVEFIFGVCTSDFDSQMHGPQSPHIQAFVQHKSLKWLHRSLLNPTCKNAFRARYSDLLTSNTLSGVGATLQSACTCIPWNDGAQSHVITSLITWNSSSIFKYKSIICLWVANYTVCPVPNGAWDNSGPDLSLQCELQVGKYLVFANFVIGNYIKLGKPLENSMAFGSQSFSHK